MPCKSPPSGLARHRRSHAVGFKQNQPGASNGTRGHLPEPQPGKGHRRHRRKAGRYPQHQHSYNISGVKRSVRNFSELPGFSVTNIKWTSDKAYIPFGWAMRVRALPICLWLLEESPHAPNMNRHSRPLHHEAGSTQVIIELRGVHRGRATLEGHSSSSPPT